MLKSGRKQLMQLFIVRAKRINFIAKVVFNSSELVLFLIEITSLLLNVLKIEQMFFVLHFDYIKCYNER